MKQELKKAIISFIFENKNVFQLTNITTDHFRNYIYTPEGDYLIGGEDVMDFIKNAIELITNN